MIGFWSDQRIEELKLRWNAGESCSEIGGAMGASRNAVIGKIHRLDLPGRRSGRSEFEKQESKRRAAERNGRNQRLRRERARVQEVNQVEEPIAAMPAYEGSLDIPFADLRDYSTSEPNMCRFIADEPPGPLYLACGTITPPGEPYCHHCKQTTLSKSTLSQPERAMHIRIGVRKHLRALRQGAAA